MIRSIRSSFVTAALLIVLVAPLTRAAVITTNVSTLDNNTGLGYDPDKPAPLITDNGFHASGGVGDYNSFRFTPSAVGLTGLKLGDIASIAYQHQQPGGGLDWQMKVYTEPQNGVGWYGVRLNYNLSTANADGTASLFTDTNADAERIKPYGVADVYNANNAAAFTAALGAAADQPVLFFDISAGAATGGYAYNADLQNITVSTTSGDQAVITASPVPEPTSLACLGVGACGLLGRRRRK